LLKYSSGVIPATRLNVEQNNDAREKPASIEAL